MSGTHVCMMEGCNNAPAPGLNICHGCDDKQQTSLREMLGHRPPQPKGNTMSCPHSAWGPCGSCLRIDAERAREADERQELSDARREALALKDQLASLTARLEQGEALLRRWRFHDLDASYDQIIEDTRAHLAVQPLATCAEHGTPGCAFPGCGAANPSQSSTLGKEGVGSLVSEAPTPPAAHPSWCGKPSTMAPNEIVWCKEHEPVAPPAATDVCSHVEHTGWKRCPYPGKAAPPVAPSTGGRAHKLRLKLFEMRDAREVTSAAGFELTTEAKAKLYDIQQDIVRAAIAADDLALDPPPPSGGTSAPTCRGTGWTQQGSISCPGCPHCRPTTCRYSNVDCPGPAFCTAAACRPIPTTGGDLRDPTTEAALQTVLDEAEERRRRVEHRIMKAAGISPCPNRSSKEYVHGDQCDAIAAVLEASPVDPRAAVLSVECPVHARPGFPCFNSAGGFTGYCASRIRAALATPLQGKRR